MEGILDGDALLTAAEVAKRLGLSTTTIYDLARRGGIPHIRVGKAIRFSRPHLERWLLSGGDGGVPLPAADPPPPPPPDPKRQLKHDLTALGLHPGVVTHLVHGAKAWHGRGGYQTVEDLRQMPVRDFRVIYGIGRARLIEVLTALGREDEIPADDK
jgi:excisionase family DNA binding protein